MYKTLLRETESPSTIYNGSIFTFVILSTIPVIGWFCHVWVLKSLLTQRTRTATSTSFPFWARALQYVLASKPYAHAHYGKLVHIVVLQSKGPYCLYLAPNSRNWHGKNVWQLARSINIWIFGVKGLSVTTFRLRVFVIQVSRSEHAHFEECRPPNLMRMLSTKHSYS